MKKIKIDHTLLGYVVLILVGVTASITGAFIINQINELQKPPAPMEDMKKSSQYPDYDAIKGENKSEKITPLVITKNCPEEGCINDIPASIDFDGISKLYRVVGKFSRAYLYIEAMVDYSRPLTSWDGIYFTINQWGGHLIEDSNVLPVPPSDISRFLYNLQSISFYPTLDNKLDKTNLYSNFNVFSLLQNSNVLNIRVTISSDRPGRVLREASIYYECFEGSECRIEELGKEIGHNILYLDTLR